MNWFWPSDAALERRQAGQTPLLYEGASGPGRPLPRRNGAPEGSRSPAEGSDAPATALWIRGRVAAWLAGRDHAPPSANEDVGEAVVVNFPRDTDPRRGR